MNTRRPNEEAILRRARLLLDNLSSDGSDNDTRGHSRELSANVHVLRNRRRQKNARDRITQINRRARAQRSASPSSSSDSSDLDSVIAQEGPRGTSPPPPPEDEAAFDFQNAKHYTGGLLKESGIVGHAIRVHHQRLTKFPLNNHLYHLWFTKKNENDRRPIKLSHAFLPMRYALLKAIGELKRHYNRRSQESREVRFCILHPEIRNGIQSSFQVLSTRSMDLANEVINLLMTYLHSNSSLLLDDSFKLDIQVLSIERTRGRKRAKNYHSPRRVSGSSGDSPNYGTPPTSPSSPQPGPSRATDGGDLMGNPSLDGNCHPYQRRKWFQACPAGYDLSSDTRAAFVGNCLIASLIMALFLLKDEQKNSKTHFLMFRDLVTERRPEDSTKKPSRLEATKWRRHVTAGKLLEAEIKAFTRKTQIASKGPYPLDICEKFAKLHGVQVFIWCVTPEKKGNPLQLHRVYPERKITNYMIHLFKDHFERGHIHVVRNLKAMFEKFQGSICVLCRSPTSRLNRHKSCRERQHFCPSCQRIKILQDPEVPCPPMDWLMSKYCNSDISTEVPFSCENCGALIRSENCFKVHQASICQQGCFCPRCSIFIRKRPRERHEAALRAHKCGFYEKCRRCFETISAEADHCCQMTPPRFCRKYPGINVYRVMMVNSSTSNCERCNKLQSAESGDDDISGVRFRFKLCQNHQNREFSKFTEAVAVVLFTNGGTNNTLSRRTFLPPQLKDAPENYEPFVFQVDFLAGQKSKTQMDIEDSIERANLKAKVDQTSAASNPLDSFLSFVLGNGGNETYVCHDSEELGLLTARLLYHDINIRTWVKGHVIICALIERYHIKFITFAAFFDGSLYDLAASELVVETPFFPEKLLKPSRHLSDEIVHYSGPIPGIEEFTSILDSRDMAKAKMKYVEKRRRMNDRWTYGTELVKCCTSQCIALAALVVKFLASSFKFQDEMLKLGVCRNFPNANHKKYIHPFEIGSTLPTFAYALLKNYTLPSEDYYTIQNEYSGMNGIRDRISTGEHMYLELVKSRLPPDAPLLRTAFNHPEGQVTIRYGPKRVKVDGWHFDESNRRITVYEYAGCYIHGHWVGNKDCRDTGAAKFSSPLAVNSKTGKTFVEAFREFSDKTAGCISFLKQEYPEFRVNLEVMWSCQFAELRKDNFFSKKIPGGYKPRPFDRLKARDAIHGLTPEVFELNWKRTDNPGESLHHYDLNSAFPNCAVKFYYPTGRFTTELADSLKERFMWSQKDCKFREDDNTWSTVHGLMYVKILPPRNLKRPYLPTKIGGKVMKGLCKSCMEKKQLVCRHSVSRSFTDVYTIVDLLFSLSLGYEIVDVYEALLYRQMSKHLAPFYKIAFREKLKCSLDSSEATQENIDWLNERMEYEGDWRLKIDDFQHNPVQKKFLKLLQNSSLGHLAIDYSKTHSIIAKTAEEFKKPFLDEFAEVRGLVVLHESYCHMTVAKKNDYNPRNRKGCTVSYAYILSYARRSMYQEMQKLEANGCTVLATDVDGLVFRKNINTPCPLTLSPAMGDWKDVFKGTHVIEEFVALAPRITKFIVRDRQTSELSCKAVLQSFSIESKACSELIEDENFMIMLDNSFGGRETNIFFPQRRTQTPSIGDISKVLKTHEFTSHLLTKQIVHKEANTYKTKPFGYKIKTLKHP